MDNLDYTAEELFNKIRSRFQDLRLFLDDTNEYKPTDDYKKARIFIFKFKDISGKAQSSVTISLVEPEHLKIIFNKQLLSGETENFKWKNFLLSMRKFARRHRLIFDVRDITKNNLLKRDFEQIPGTTKISNPLNTRSNALEESANWIKSHRMSYELIGETKLIVKHKMKMDPELTGRHGRHIAGVFLETAQGERFRMPHNRLTLGRAMAQHINHGGHVYDALGQHITGIAEEMDHLSFFIRSTRSQVFEDTETADMVTVARSRFADLREQLRSFTGRRGYHKQAQTFSPSDFKESDFDMHELQERFVRKIYNERLNMALPYVFRAYNSQLNSQHLVTEFANWAEDITKDDDVIDYQNLNKLMSKPIRAGQDGIDALEAMSGIINSDELAKLLTGAAQEYGADTDVRDIIDQWLSENDPDYVSNYDSLSQNQTDVDQTSNTQAMPNPQYQQASPQMNKESAFEDLMRLAGLKS